MNGNMCNGCGEIIPIHHACVLRLEGDSGEDVWDASIYHAGHEVTTVCEDCNMHRKVCEECCDPFEESESE